MFSYERSVNYPEGPPQCGLRPARHPPAAAPAQIALSDKPGPAPDTQMLYRYLRQFDGIVASHTRAPTWAPTGATTIPMVEPVVEIYQGDRQNYEMPGAPRSNTADDSIGGWRPLGFVSLALKKGYRLGFQASSDHVSTHMSYCNLWVTSPTREGIMEAFHKRRVYGSTDNILADVRCGSHFMGEEFAPSEAARDFGEADRGAANFAKVHVIKDGEYVYSIEPGRRTSISSGRTPRPKRARPAITTSAASRPTASWCGSARCGSLINRCKKFPLFAWLPLPKEPAPPLEAEDLPWWRRRFRLRLLNFSHLLRERMRNHS